MQLTPAFDVVSCEHWLWPRASNLIVKETAPNQRSFIWTHWPFRTRPRARPRPRSFWASQCRGRGRAGFKILFLGLI